MTWPFVQDAIPILYYGKHPSTFCGRRTPRSQRLLKVKSNPTLEAPILPTAKRESILIPYMILGSLLRPVSGCLAMLKTSPS